MLWYRGHLTFSEVAGALGKKHKISFVFVCCFSGDFKELLLFASYN
ncbi:hypothetical protein [Chryseobacterium sp. CT-SW4]